MKKVLVACCSLCCLSLFGNAFAADEICYAIDVGGPMEQGKCSDKGLHDKCNPLNAPSNGGWCIDTPDDYYWACAAMTCNEGYLLWLTNTRQDAGRVIKAENNRKVGVQGLCFKKSDLEAKCKNACSNCPGDTKECKLKEREVTVTYKPNGETSNIVKTSKAFIGEEACICVAKNGGGNGGNSEDTPETIPAPDTNPKSDCWFKMDVTVTCANGKTYKENETFYLTQEQVDKLGIDQCDKETDLWEFLRKQKPDKLKDIDTPMEFLEKLINQKCNNKIAVGPSVVPGGDGGVESAKRTLRAFFASADKEKKSVWINEQGKFNTARLASDLTAGVVLGTVGGVVSGVVIKKKQVEKGFDALHCTVLGQTIADWGDTFNVGFKRY